MILNEGCIRFLGGFSGSHLDAAVLAVVVVAYQLR